MKARWKGEDWTDYGERPAHETPGDVAAMFAEQQTNVNHHDDIFDRKGDLRSHVEVMDDGQITTWKIEVDWEPSFSARRAGP